MIDMKSSLNRVIRSSIQAVLLLLLAAYMVSGLGITEARTAETLSFGLLTKPVAFQLHNNLLIPFIIFLVLHIAYKPISRAVFKSSK
jgi:cytochrome b561